MPVVFRYGEHKFFFYSNEGSPREPLRSMYGEVRTRRNSGLTLRSESPTMRATMLVPDAIGKDHRSKRYRIERDWNAVLG